MNEKRFARNVLILLKYYYMGTYRVPWKIFFFGKIDIAPEKCKAAWFMGFKDSLKVTVKK
jgi:hypothetical protein